MVDGRWSYVLVKYHHRLSMKMCVGVNCEYPTIDIWVVHGWWEFGFWITGPTRTAVVPVNMNRDCEYRDSTVRRTYDTTGPNRQTSNP